MGRVLLWIVIALAILIGLAFAFLGDPEVPRDTLMRKYGGAPSQFLQLPSGAMVHIIENPDAPSAPSHHTAFEVDDIDAAHVYMQSKGVTPTAIQTRNDGQKAFYINDPDGNRIEICTKSGFGVLV